MTAIRWPLALAVRLEIEPIVAPVLSWTGSPTLSAAAPAVALVLAPAVLAEGAFAPDGRLLEGMLEDGALLEGMLLLEDGSELDGIDNEPDCGVAPWVWARAWPAIARAMPAAATKGVTERTKISLNAAPAAKRMARGQDRSDILCAGLGGGGPQIDPSVFSRAFGWISFWLSTTVWPRNRSTMERI
jgi:hypothetical protein